MFASAIAFFGARKWLAWLLLIVALAALGLWLHFHTLDEGISIQQARDANSYAKQLADADAKTLAAQIRADAAEVAYVHEYSEGQKYRTEHPLTGASELCLGAASAPAAVPKAAAAVSGNVRAAPAAAVLQPVPARDSAVSATRLGLLGALAGEADRVNAVARGLQASVKP